MGANNFIDQIDLLSNLSRVQVPWIKVTIADEFTFGVFDAQTRALISDEKSIYLKAFNIEYPNFVKTLKIKKINGQINRYTLGISYPITQFDDPNFFEKVFSRAGTSRKIVFSYGDISQPGFLYRNEEAIITKVGQTFTLEASRIDYTIEAVSAAAVKTTGSANFIAPGKKIKPSDEIKRIFQQDTSLQNMFTGMKAAKLDQFIAGDDQAVELESKEGIAVLDYINYLVSCMKPVDSPEGLPTANYILTIHDNSSSSSDSAPGQTEGPFFKVTKIDKKVDKDGAFVLTVGYNTSTVVTNFALENNENYAIYYDYQTKIHPKKYIRRLDNMGQWIDEYAPIVTTSTELKRSTTAKENWWKLITQYPINASVTIMGLLRPATLMQYVRLNVVFPGGHKHISSGLYLVTSQEDSIDERGYYTTLGLTKIGGDEEYKDEFI
jgi:hypothetical protein